jgi:hypothetical protein
VGSVGGVVLLLRFCALGSGVGFCGNPLGVLVSRVQVPNIIWKMSAGFGR